MLFVQLNNGYAQLFTKTFMFGLLTASPFVSRESFVPYKVPLCSQNIYHGFSETLRNIFKSGCKRGEGGDCVIHLID